MTYPQHPPHGRPQQPPPTQQFATQHPPHAQHSPQTQYPPQQGLVHPQPGAPRPPGKVPTWVWIVAAFGGLVLLGAIVSATGGSEEKDTTTKAATASAVASSVAGAPTQLRASGTTQAPQPGPPPAPPVPSAPVASSAPPAAQAVMPNVVCMNLQDAQDLIQTTGVFFSRSTDATGQGRNQIVDRNWVVVAQKPAPGTLFGEGDAVLSVVKLGERSSC